MYNPAHQHKSSPSPPHCQIFFQFQNRFIHQLAFPILNLISHHDKNLTTKNNQHRTTPTSILPLPLPPHNHPSPNHETAPYTPKNFSLSAPCCFDFANTSSCSNKIRFSYDDKNWVDLDRHTSGMSRGETVATKCIN